MGEIVKEESEKSLTARLSDLRVRSTEEIPQDTLKNMREAVDDLSRSGIVDRSMKVGDKAPAFSLPNGSGAFVHLDDLLGKGPVVVSFYRGGWCSFCSLELQALQESLSEFDSFRTTLVAISPQTQENSLSTSRKNRLTYEVLSDVGNRVARSFGIVYRLQDEMMSIYEEFGLDLAEYNGDDSFELPIPATFVIDQTGTIRLAFIDPDYTRRLDPTEILVTLRKLNSPHSV